MSTIQSVLSNVKRFEFPIGETHDGELLKADLTQINHLLVAGASGSGKSVFTETMLLTLVSHNRPDDLRIALCDTKGSEFSQYSRIGHTLAIPCCTKEKICGLLQLVLLEGEKRLKSLSEISVKSVSAFNDFAWEHFSTEMPRILVVIDDITSVLTTSPELVRVISRLFSIGRTVGIHIVGITQTPASKQVKSIASLFTSRIIFQALPTDLRFVTGKRNPIQPENVGDAWYCCMASSVLVHGIAVNASESFEILEAISNKTSIQEETKYTEIRDFIYTNIPEPGSPEICTDQPEENDELLPAAVEVVLETGQASVSMLQRRLKLAYSRAARLVDQMEQKGYVGPFEGSKPRQLLLTKAKWQEIKSAHYEADYTETHAERCTASIDQSADTKQTKSSTEELHLIIDETTESMRIEKYMESLSMEAPKEPPKSVISKRLKRLFTK